MAIFVKNRDKPCHDEASAITRRAGCLPYLMVVIDHIEYRPGLTGHGRTIVEARADLPDAPGPHIDGMRSGMTAIPHARHRNAFSTRRDQSAHHKSSGKPHLFILSRPVSVNQRLNFHLKSGSP